MSWLPLGTEGSPAKGRGGSRGRYVESHHCPANLLPSLASAPIWDSPFPAPLPPTPISLGVQPTCQHSAPSPARGGGCAEPLGVREPAPRGPARGGHGRGIQQHTNPNITINAQAAGTPSRAGAWGSPEALDPVFRPFPALPAGQVVGGDSVPRSPPSSRREGKRGTDVGRGLEERIWVCLPRGQGRSKTPPGSGWLWGPISLPPAYTWRRKMTGIGGSRMLGIYTSPLWEDHIRSPKYPHIALPPRVRNVPWELF